MELWKTLKKKQPSYISEVQKVFKNKYLKVFSKIVIRMFWYSSTLFLLNFGLKYVPLAVNNALMNTSPLLVMFLEAYLYKVIHDLFI